MGFRHVFLPPPTLSLTRSLEEHKEKKGSKQNKQKTPKRSIVHDTAVEKCLILEMKLATVQLMKQLFNYLYLLRRLLKVQEKKHHKSIFFSWLKDRTSVPQNKIPESTEHNFPLDAGVDPNIHNRK